jgi:hypothetical protein
VLWQLWRFRKRERSEGAHPGQHPGEKRRLLADAKAVPFFSDKSRTSSSTAGALFSGGKRVGRSHLYPLELFPVPSVQDIGIAIQGGMIGTDSLLIDSNCIFLRRCVGDCLVVQ